MQEEQHEPADRTPPPWHLEATAPEQVFLAPSWAPNRKPLAGFAGANLGIIITYIAEQFGLVMPNYVAMAIVAFLGFTASYIVPPETE